MSKARFGLLLDIIKFRERLSEAEICSQLGYAEGYLSQVKSRGNIPKKLITRLMEKYNIEDDDIKEESLTKEPTTQNKFLDRLDELLVIIRLQQETMKMQQETIQTLSTTIAQSKRSA